MISATGRPPLDLQPGAGAGILGTGHITEDPMAGGWTRDGAVSEQIEASIEDELARMKSRRHPRGESLSQCADCDDPIPEARRKAVAGVRFCVTCQQQADSADAAISGPNRRGSKDSQLR